MATALSSPEISPEEFLSSGGYDSDESPKTSVSIPQEAPGQPGRTQLAAQNNNPGNLTDTSGAFKKYDTPEEGYQDLVSHIKKHSDKGQTLEKYLSQYAPPSQNDTETYIRNAEKATGASRSTLLSDIDHDKLAAFQAKQESSASVQPAPAISPEAFLSSAPAVSPEDFLGQTGRFTGAETGAPPIAKPPLAPELRTGPATIDSGAPTYQNPRTGVRYARQAPGVEGGPLSITDKLITGPLTAAGGVEQMAQPGLREKASGAAKVIGGTLETATPLMAGEALVSPVISAIALGAGTLSQEAAGALLKKLDVPQEYNDLGSALAGLAGGAAGVKLTGLPGMLREAAFRNQIKNILQDNLNREFYAKQKAEDMAAQAAQPTVTDAGEVGPVASATPATTPPSGNIVEGEFEEVPGAPLPKGAAPTVSPEDFLKATPTAPQPSTEIALGNKFEKSGSTFSVTDIKDGKVQFQKEDAAGAVTTGTLSQAIFKKMMAGATPVQVGAQPQVSVPPSQKEVVQPNQPAAPGAAGAVEQPQAQEAPPVNAASSTPIAQQTQQQTPANVSGVPKVEEETAAKINEAAAPVAPEQFSQAQNPLPMPAAAEASPTAIEGPAAETSTAVSSPQPSIADLLGNATRQYKIGGEPMQESDPRAQLILKSLSPEHQQAIDSLIAGSGAVNPHVLASGFDHVVLDLGNGEVMRMGRRPQHEEDSPYVLKPVASQTFGDVGVEIYPKVNTAGITPADVETVKSDLAQQGLHWDDAAPDNLGRDAQGNLKILDGQVKKIQSGAPSTAVEKQEVVPPKTQTEHEFSSTHFNMPQEVSTAIQKVGKQVPDAKLGPEGRETEPHVTLLYGLETQTPKDVKDLLKGEGPITVTLGKSSLFRNEDADVLKVDVDSPQLHALNAKLRTLPNGNKFPEFAPHVTVAYLKPGEGEKYDGKVLQGITGKTITLDTVTFSDKDKGKTEIPLQSGAPAKTTTPKEAFKMKAAELTELAKKGDTGAVAELKRRNKPVPKVEVAPVQVGAPPKYTKGERVAIDDPQSPTGKRFATYERSETLQTASGPREFIIASGARYAANWVHKPTGVVPKEEEPTVKHTTAAIIPTRAGVVAVPIKEVGETVKVPEDIRKEEGSSRELLGMIPIDIRREQAEPIRDIRSNPTGWLHMSLRDGTALIHPTEDKVIKFEAKNSRSGTDVYRARGLAQAYAIDNPIEATAAKLTEPGNLVVKPLFEKKPVTPQVPSEPGQKYVLPAFATKGAAKVEAITEKPVANVGDRVSVKSPDGRSEEGIVQGKTEDGMFRVQMDSGKERSVHPTRIAPLATSEEKPTISAGNEPAAPATGEPTGEQNSEPLAAQLPEGNEGAGAGEPVAAGSSAGGRKRVSSKRASSGEGSELEPSGGTVSGVVGDAAKPEQTFPPRASDVVSTHHDRDYRIPDGRVVSGSPETRAKGNIEAIRTMREIQQQNRPATVEEQKILAQYVGWGAVPQLFAKRPGFEALHDELNKLLSAEEFEEAQRSTTNAHYTSDEIVDSMWKAVQSFGAKPGMSWLEPAVGVGNFFGRQPQELLEGARRVGLDKDSLSAQIAKLLYPDSGIDHVAFEDAELPNNYFDGSVSNIPFGNFGVHDATFKGKPYITGAIHNYFFAKALNAVRPGGVVAFVTSRYTMDAMGAAAVNFRKYIAEQAHLIGAVRLPTGAFRQSSGTDVITDLIFLRKRLPGEESKGDRFEQSVRKLIGYTPFETNEYFQKHPENILGKEGTSRGQFSANDYDVSGNVTSAQIAKAIDGFGKAASGKNTSAIGFEDWQRGQRKRTVAIREINAPAEQSKLGGLFFDDKGDLFRKTSKGSAEPVDISDSGKARIKSQLAVRDVLQKLIAAELGDEPEGKLTAMRRNLNSVYDGFVKRYGPLSSQANTAAMSGDPDAPLLVSLERSFQKGNKAKGVTPAAEKAPIFSKRVLRPAQPPTSVSDPKEALYIALNEKGRVDFDRMSDLTGRTPEELQQDLAGLIFQDPHTKTWQTADEYLSGSVRKKLKEARAIAKIEPNYAGNVKALENVQPEDIPPGEIRALLGVSWVPLQTYSDFATEVLGANKPVTVKYVGGNWMVDTGWGNPLANKDKWGTARVPADKLLADSLNMVRTKVIDRDSDGNTSTNITETQSARAKQMEMQEHFEKWLFEDSKRGDELVRLYNDTHNDLRLRHFDGAHLTLPGMSTSILRSGDLDAHQKSAVWRVMSQPNVLLAHGVGAGKTFEMIAGGMELKRLGLIRRPMYVVPNATLTSWQDQFGALYPQARTLVFSEKDLEKENRKRVMAQIATGDWDAVVVPHSSFQFLPTGDEIFNQHYDKLAAELTEQIMEAQAEDMDTRMVKRMENSKERLLTSLKDRRQNEKKDQTVSWEQLGIDHLFVDESHEFKKLGFATKQGNIAGIDNEGNQKTFDLLMKMRYTQTHGRGVVFASGTPITNTMGEMFSIMKYLIEPELEARGIGKFDEWAANFGRTVDVFEPKVQGGGYQMKARFAKFVNLPELIQLFRSFADVVTADMIKLPIPNLVGGERMGVTSDLTEAQEEILKDLQRRAENIKKDPRNALPDNMLAVYSDAAKMAMDARMIDPTLSDNPDGRLTQAADKIYEHWKDSAKVKGTQLVISDMGKPASEGGSSEFSAYDDLIKKLLDRGIPKNEIATIYQAKNKAQRAQLFRDVNDGKVRVLLGSTQKMGVGVNVQKRLYALHHLDIPHRPSDLEQREGRILRQGNENPEVYVHYYMTRGSLDEAKFANVIRKAKFINSAMQGKTSVRETEDVGGMIASLQMFQAATSGDPRVMKKMEVDAEVDRLSNVYSGWKNQQYKIRNELSQVPWRIANAQKSIASLNSDIAVRDKTGEKWQVGKDKFEGDKISKEVNEALTKQVNKVAESKAEGVQLGQAFGLPVEADYNPAGKFVKVDIGDNLSLTVTSKEMESGVDFYRRIKNQIEALPEKISDREQIIERAKKEQVNLQKSVEDVWPYAEKFQKLVEEQKQLVKDLGGDKGDDAALAAEPGQEIADKSVEAEEAPDTEDEEEGEEKPLGLTKEKKGERGSAPILSDLAQSLRDKFGSEEAAKANYSGLGALESRFSPGGNLGQIERASKSVHTAAIRAASDRAQAMVIWRQASPQMQAKLAGGDVTMPELRLALIESRLQGLRDRWNNLATQAEAMSDEDLSKSYDEAFAGLLRAVSGKKDLPQDLEQTAAALHDAKDMKTLREFLAETFREASDNVTTAMEPEWFDAVTEDRHFRDALKVYKNLVEKPLAENHSINEGVFSDALGPLDTYYPLISLDRKQAQGPGRRLAYHKPKNIANAFATGMAAGYDPGVEALLDRISAAVRSNDKAALLTSLEGAGLLRKLAKNEGMPEAFPYRGEEYEPEKVEISPGRLLIQNGKTTPIPAVFGVMPRWAAHELRPILERQPQGSETALDSFINALNTITLTGVAEPIFHASNLLGTLIANTPFLENSVGGKLMSAPFVKKFGAIYQIAKTDPSTEEAANDLIEMSKLGLIPTKYGSLTFNRKTAEEMGSKLKRFSLAPILFGPKGIDIRARLVMYRLAKSINPDATPQETYHFVNQLGNYVPALQSEMERAMKRTGFSPFITAGTTMLRNGFNAWTGAGPMPKSGLNMRLWQQFTGGALFMLAAWVLIYKEMTGKMPWNDKESKLMAVPAPHWLRRSRVGIALWGKGPEVGYINLNFFNPLIMRGGRAMGIPGAYEAHVLGGNFGQQLEAAQRDMMNSFAQPFLGPPVKAAFVGITGQEPYVTGLRDRQGKVGVQLFPMIPPKTKPGLPALGQRGIAALREINSFYGSVGEATGLLGQDQGRKGNKWAKMLTDYTVPGLVGNATNPFARAEMLKQQRSGTR